MHSLETETNKTTRFLVPMLFQNTTYDELLTNGFRQAYIGLLDDPSYDDSLVLIFDSDVETNIISELLDEVDFVTEDDPYFKDTQMIVIDDWLPLLKDPEDYSRFLSGLWSELSTQSKRSILSYWNENETSTLATLMNKDLKKLRMIESFSDTIFMGHTPDKDAELIPAPNVVEDELYYPSVGNAYDSDIDSYFDDED